MKKQNKTTGILLAFCVPFLLLFAMGCEVPKALDRDMEVPRLIEANELRESQRGGYTLNEIRVMLQQGGVSGFKRVYRPDGGSITYQIPAEELLEIFGSPMIANEIQAFRNFNYAVRPIIGEGRRCSESIVIVLLGDGFTVGNGYGQVGNHLNPGSGTFLRSAHEFAQTLISTYPFSLFSDIIKIYAVETPSTHQGIRVGTAPYPGTYFGIYIDTMLPANIGRSRIRTAHALNISNWVSPYAIMTQIIANTREFGGVAFWEGASYSNINTVGVSTRFLNTFAPGWNRPYHFILVHEIGHNFGKLVDEHSRGFGWPNNLGHANMARATDTDAQLRWGHWLGHEGITRRTVDAPAGYIFPSANYSCIMQGWFTSFCAVCRAELTRRMAMISGETFEPGRRPDGTPRPPRHTITVTSQHNRILPYAFHGNTSLQTIIIPASINTIGDFAFLGATGLRFATIPNAVTRIGRNAFLNTGIWNNTRLNNVVYADRWAVGYRGIINPSDELSLRPNTVGIGDNAFSQVSGLREVIIPNSVTHIGTGAFSNNPNFNRIWIPASVTHIDSNAFANCPALRIYVQATSKPHGWNANWNPQNRPVIWGSPEPIFGGGTGTQSNPFLISNYRHFNNIHLTDSSTTHFRLENDINFGSFQWWDPRPVFRGHLNGNGKTIHNRFLGVAGLFEENHGTIENLTVIARIEGVHFSSAGVIARVNYGTISNCIIEHDPDFENLHIHTGILGGIAAFNEEGGIIKNSTNNANIVISPSARHGGTVSNCADTFVGGIVGVNRGIIMGNINTGEIFTVGMAGGFWNAKEYIGGIAGVHEYGSITRNFNYGFLRNHAGTICSTLDHIVGAWYGGAYSGNTCFCPECL